MSTFLGSVWWMIVSLGVLVTFHEFGHLFLMFHHGVEGDAFHRFSGGVELFDILARQEAFGHDLVKVDGCDQQKV